MSEQWIPPSSMSSPAGRRTTTEPRYARPEDTRLELRPSPGRPLTTCPGARMPLRRSMPTALVCTRERHANLAAREGCHLAISVWQGSSSLGPSGHRPSSNWEREVLQAAPARSTECPHALGLVHPVGSLNPDPKNLTQTVINSRGF